MTQPKRNHYIPQFLLRRFTDERGRLHFFDKKRCEKGVLESTPKDLFVEGHLYTVVNASGSKDTSAEKYFNTLETRAEIVLKKIVSAAEARILPKLTAEERDTWHHFMYHQWVRVPEQYKSLWPENHAGAVIDEQIEEFTKTVRPLTSAEETMLADEHHRKRLIKNALIQSLIIPGKRAIEVLQEIGLGIAVIPRNNKAFIIGSIPMVRFGPSMDSDLRSPGVELWFPISSKVAVCPVGPARSERLILIQKDRQIRAINTAIFRQSQLVAGHSRPLIISITTHR